MEPLAPSMCNARSRWTGAVLCALLLLALPAASASAQSRATPTPSYDLSIALHVVAVSAVGLATAALVAQVLACDTGTVCDREWIFVGLTGLGLLVVSLGVGIAASVVHAQTRAARTEAGLAWTPYFWIDPAGGGAGLVLRL